MSVATTCRLREIPCSDEPSERLVRALAPFGLLARRAARAPLDRSEHLDALLDLPARSIALVRGPSGCGKSTLVAQLASEARSRSVRVIDAARITARLDAAKPLIDLFTDSVARTRRLLSLAGLGEARLWARGSAEISEGERARLVIAMAMSRAPAWSDCFVLLDEFCSTLDRPTARAVSRALRAWARADHRVRVVCATAHDDLTDALDPDLVLDMGGGQ
jgi:ABC-type ATPase with predicted acetyltransferase domain